MELMLIKVVGSKVDAKRVTPSRTDRAVSVEPQQPKRAPSPKTVRFEVDGATEGSKPAQGQLVRGTQPQAKVSPDRTESQLNYKISNPRLNHMKNIHIAQQGGVPLTIKAFDNRNLVVGCADGSLKILDIATSAVVKQYKFASRVTVVEEISDDGRSTLTMGALIGLGGPDNAIVLLDLSTSESALNKFRAHTDEVTGIISLGGLDFLSCSADGTIGYWSTTSQTPVNRIQAHQGRINSMATLNNNATLVTGGDDCLVQVFNVRKGEVSLKRTIRESSPVVHVSSFYGNSKFAFSCQQNGAIKIWNVETGE